MLRDIFGVALVGDRIVPAATNRAGHLVGGAATGSGYRSRPWNTAPTPYINDRLTDRHLLQALGHLPEHYLIRNDEYIEPTGDYYYTNLLSDEAASYIQKQKGAANLFFRYLAYTAPHWLLHARDEDIEKYEGRYQGGWDKLRAERYQQMLEVGAVEKKWGIAPRDPETPAWESVPNKEWQQRRMEVYAAQIESLDRGIGRVLEALQAAGLADNTLVMFLADNGGCAETIANEPRFGNGSGVVNGQKVLWGNRPELMPGPAGTFQSYGPEWAHLSNTPFRLYKHWVSEGGGEEVAHGGGGVTAGNAGAIEPAEAGDGEGPGESAGSAAEVTEPGVGGRLTAVGS